MFAMVLAGHEQQAVQGDWLREVDLNFMGELGAITARVGAGPIGVRISIQDFLGRLAVGSGGGPQFAHDQIIREQTGIFRRGNRGRRLESVSGQIIQQ